MKTITVITVNLNNSIGLKKTLESLLDLHYKPTSVIIIDGGSVDNSLSVVTSFQDKLPIKFLSEKDHGIYDAMNKGKRLVITDFIHYLNSGDIVFGEPYASISSECLLPVRLISEKKQFIKFDSIKFFGCGYCHQGIIYSSSHPNFDERFSIAGDFDLNIRHFGCNLRVLPIVSSGGVCYQLGGLSSQRFFVADKEALFSLLRNYKISLFLFGIIYIVTKRLIPRFIRRSIFRNFF
jgi:glycosyltransferase involved in cell wall biosynthesis